MGSNLKEGMTSSFPAAKSGQVFFSFFFSGPHSRPKGAPRLGGQLGAAAAGLHRRHSHAMHHEGAS